MLLNQGHLLNSHAVLIKTLLYSNEKLGTRPGYGNPLCV